MREVVDPKSPLGGVRDSPRPPFPVYGKRERVVITAVGHACCPVSLSREIDTSLVGDRERASEHWQMSCDSRHLSREYSVGAQGSSWTLTFKLLRSTPRGPGSSALPP